MVSFIQSCTKDIQEEWNNGNLKTLIHYHNSNRSEYSLSEYYENGTIKLKTSFKNNLLNGDYRQYYTNGQLKLYRKYKMGKIEGVEQQFNENGEIKSQIIYRNTHIIDKQEYNSKVYN